MGIRHHECPPEAYFFDEFEGKCVDAIACPGDKSIWQPAEKVCTTESQSFALNNDDCRKYLVCANSGSIWSWKEEECRMAYYFNQEAAECQPGRCGGCLDNPPSYANCDNNGVGHKFLNKHDCTKYYSCEPNPSGCGDHSWGAVLQDCPPDLYFDPVSKSCITAAACPQECPDEMEDQSVCKTDGQVLQSKECRGEVVCKWVEFCASKSFEGYWARSGVYCDEDNMYYDATLDKCVEAWTCPQDKNCPGAVWERMGTDPWGKDLLVGGYGWCRAHNYRDNNTNLGFYFPEMKICGAKTAQGYFYHDQYDVLSAKSTGLSLSNVGMTKVPPKAYAALPYWRDQTAHGLAYPGICFAGGKPKPAIQYARSDGEFNSRSTFNEAYDPITCREGDDKANVFKFVMCEQ